MESQLFLVLFHFNVRKWVRLGGHAQRVLLDVDACQLIALGGGDLHGQVVADGDSLAGGFQGGGIILDVVVSLDGGVAVVVALIALKLAFFTIKKVIVNVILGADVYAIATYIFHIDIPLLL